MPDLAGGRRSLPGPRVLAAVFLPVLALLGLILVAHLVADAPLAQVMEDPADTYEAHPFIGAGSAIGILIWWSGVVACLFAWALLARADDPSRLRAFLLWSGLLTAVLVLDDQFLLHEDLADRYLDLGQRHIVVAYLAIAAVYALAFRRTLMRAEWGLLALSVGLLAGSLAADYVHEKVFLPMTGEYVPIITFGEDALKLLGIAAWSAFFVRFSFEAVTRARPLPATSRAGTSRVGVAGANAPMNSEASRLVGAEPLSERGGR